MTQQTTAQGLSGRALALARRKALSGAGKKAETSSSPNRTRADSMTRKAAAAPAQAPARQPSEVRASAASKAPTTAPIFTPSAPVRSRAGASSGSVSRSAALARRKAMSTRGKVAAGTKDRVRNGQRNRPLAEDLQAVKNGQAAGKDGGCTCGCGGKDGADSKTTPAVKPAVSSRMNNRTKLRGQRRNEAAKNPGRAASLARRRAQSARGKAGVSASGMTPAQTARASNPELSGRELAQALRDQRNRRGGAGQKKSAPTGRQRPSRNNATQGAAKDQPWKVGVGETSHGQAVTGTMVGRSKDVTGDEASTCRSVTGTEYMGADIFRDFCQAEPAKSTLRIGSSDTSQGNQVTGNKVGRSLKVTGDEPGTCKNVTGAEYVGAEQMQEYCGVVAEPHPPKVSGSKTSKGKTVTGNQVGRSGRVTGVETGAGRQLTGTQYTQIFDVEGGAPAAPPKVGASATLRGGMVTGVMLGRRENMTGDEPGSCRNITGDDYVGQEQYAKFCPATPAPRDRKVGFSRTLSGETVTGTMTGRSSRVTGDEPGTCKSVTGTPYAGAEQYGGFCAPEQAESAAARMRVSKRSAGAPMSGIQPSVGGRMTGDDKGACESVSGTPYLGADQQAEVCPAIAAEPGSADFPQPLDGAPWGDFSVSPPSQAAAKLKSSSGVTGAVSYDKGHITGPFGMAGGKVTGTDEARFGRAKAPAQPAAPEERPEVEGRVKSRITGEGIDAGQKITGDDWDRGDRVTGTEGASAKRRNPTIRSGPRKPMAAERIGSRDESVPEPVSKVTGSSGNTGSGSLVTYSGGARG